MNTHHTQKIIVCKSCNNKGTECQPGFELIEKLRVATKAVGDVIIDDFKVSSMACYDRTRSVANRGNQKASYLFDGIDPFEDIDDLVTFAREYNDMDDGWSSSSDSLAKLNKIKHAKVPPAMIVMQASAVRAL